LTLPAITASVFRILVGSPLPGFSLGFPCHGAAGVRNFSTRGSEWCRNMPHSMFPICS